MKITERIAHLLTRFKNGDQQAFVNEYLWPLQQEVREALDNAANTNDMLRYQGQARLLARILRDIDESDTVLTKLKTRDKTRRPT